MKNYEVWEWNISKKMEFVHVFSGDSLILAIVAIVKSKLQGAGCVRFEIRVSKVELWKTE